MLEQRSPTSGSSPKNLISYRLECLSLVLFLWIISAKNQPCVQESEQETRPLALNRPPEPTKEPPDPPEPTREPLNWPVLQVQYTLLQVTNPV